VVEVKPAVEKKVAVATTAKKETPTPAPPKKTDEKKEEKKVAANDSKTTSPGTTAQPPQPPPAPTASSAPAAATPGPIGTGGESGESIMKAYETGAKKDDQKGAEQSNAPQKPAEKLSPVAIKQGMEAIGGRVQACYEKYQVPGMVMVRVKISTDGTVASADATGKFENTETGTCVAHAVQGAIFPQFEGGAITIKYPFSLQ
jgi:hypothetical protein